MVLHRGPVESYRFGPFELDPGRKELRRDGSVVSVPAKSLELLQLLVRHPSRIVSRAEVLADLWPDVRVSQATLTSTLRDLRRALRDDAHTPHFLQTVRGAGFRLIEPVEARRHRQPLLGREALMARLELALDAAIAGRGRVVLLEGDPGIGKTHALTALADVARLAGATVSQGRCSESGAAAAYRPWAQLLGEIAQARPPEEIARALGPNAPLLGRLVPALAPGLEGLEALPPSHDEGTMLRLFEAVARLLRHVARDAPLVLTVDDLHGADRSSLRLLEFLGDPVLDARILIVGAYRGCELDGDHALTETLAELGRLPAYERHHLNGLDLEATRALVRDSTGREPSPLQLADIHARTDGNPLYVRELASFLADQGEAGPTGPARPVPASLRELLRGRLLRLPPTCRNVLEAAAVVGREFPIGVVQRAVELGADEVADALEHGRHAGLVDWGYGETRLFSHALVQEAIYAGLDPLRQRALHRRVGDAFASLSSADRGECLSAVAHHLCLAAEEVGTRAVAAAARAADHAESRLAYAEAARLRELALEALDRVDPTDAAGRCDLLLGVARARLAAREVVEACDTARRAGALARQLGSAERLAEAALILSDYVVVDSSEAIAMLEEALPRLGPQRPELRARGLSLLSTNLWYDGEPARRRALAEEALDLARAAGDRGGLVVALLAKRHALHAPQHLAERIRLGSEAVREAERNASDAQRCLAHSWRAVDLLAAGDLAAAERDVALVERVSQSARLLRFWGFPMRWRAMRATLEGRLVEAEKCIAEAGARMRSAEDPNAQSYAGIQLAMVLLEQGRLTELEPLLRVSEPWLDPFRERVAAARAAVALVELERGAAGAAERVLADAAADDFAAFERDPELLGTASFLAEACARLGDRELAAALYQRLSPWRSQLCCFYAIACRGSMARYLGLLAETAGRLDDAERCLDEALAANRAAGAVLYEAWTEWDRARVLARRGGADAETQAALLAARARETARQLGLGRLLAAMAAAPAG